MVGARRAFLAAVLTAVTSGVALVAPSFAPSAFASAAPSNSASTHAFILADLTLSREGERRISLSQRRAKEGERKVLHECPRAGAGSPQDEQSYALSYEAAGVLWSAAYRADAKPIAAFVRATSRLRWSNAATMHAVRRYITGLDGLSKLRKPHVCADIAAWKTSGFTRLLGTTTSFDNHLESLEATPVPSRLLLPYAGPGDRRLLALTKRIQTKLLNAETVLGSGDWYGITEGLELNP